VLGTLLGAEVAGVAYGAAAAHASTVAHGAARLAGSTAAFASCNMIEVAIRELTDAVGVSTIGKSRHFHTPSLMSIRRSPDAKQAGAITGLWRRYQLHGIKIFVVGDIGSSKMSGVAFCNALQCLHPNASS
jgi:hypothetical protein